ncbi:unnamed protein product [Withania somnifera]
MEEGAEVHGGPYAIRSKDIRKEDVVPMVNLENPDVPKEDRYDSKMKNEEVHRPVLQRQEEFARPPSLEGTHFPEERHRPPFGESHDTKHADHVTAFGKHEHQGLQGHENFGAPTGLEDRHADNRPVTADETHETKGFDHGTAPGEPGHHGLQGHENIGAPASLANQQASHFREEMYRPPAASETHETEGFDHVAAVGEIKDQGLQGRKYKVLTSLEEDPHSPRDHSEMNPNPTNSQSKVTDPTGANNEEAGIGTLVPLFDKMGVKDVPETTRKQGMERIRTEARAGDMKVDQGTEHRQYTGSHDQFAPQETPTDFPSVCKDTESNLKGMSPSNPEDLPQDTLTGKPGSYTEKISSATSAIADRAVAAKNVVASKLGYGETGEETGNTQIKGGDEDATKTSSATALAQKAASTVAEKLAPVYEKVAGAGSTVIAKVQGTAGGVAGNEAEHEGNTKATDKGVSMKEYLAEKFKPGEEDKALSEVISGSLSRRKEKTGEAKPIGKVTESEEVERQLGAIDNTKKEGNSASGETHIGEGFGQGVVDRLKGAVSTWLGKGGEAQANDSGVSGGAAVRGRVE